MSEIKTDKIIPVDAGSTTTIGCTGDTIATGAGTTLDLSQGTYSGINTVNWDTTAKTANFTAETNKGYFINTTSGSVTITLPATPVAGSFIGIKDYALTAQTNNIIINSNGNKIQGNTNNFVINTQGGAANLVYVDSTQGWLTYDAGQASDIQQDLKFVTATGGTITTCGNFKIHTFTGPGTFTVTCVGNAAGSNAVDYVVVAGGGGGGVGSAPSCRRGGGGGAGGYRESYCATTSGTYTASTLATPTSLPVSVTGYPIIVGGGGASSTTGSNSSFSSITSAAGGGGGDWNGQNGCSGGSGGGAGPKGPSIPVPSQSLGGTGNTPPVSPPQGNNGGSNPDAPSETNPQVGGGGGGAVGVGKGLTSNSRGGAGGAGAETNMPGSPLRVAGGGGGGGHDPGGTGGSFPSCISGQPAQSRINQYGGGNGEQPGSGGGNGAFNTGGGGGGAHNGGGYSGGSGIVIIRYKYQ